MQTMEVESRGPLIHRIFRKGPNPHYSQTKRGLALEVSYGVPSKIHTPFGYWTILGSGQGSPGVR